MKKIILSLFFGFQIIASVAQQAPPQGINYQAVVYAPTGNQQAGVNSAGQQPANTQQVAVTFTLEEGFNGPVIYEETHSDTTDQYGLLNSVIGTGTPTGNSPGLFNQIDWSLGDPYLRVSISLTQYSTTVTSYQKLWSVPYALFAGQANTANSANTSAYADSSNYANTAGNGIIGVIDNGNGTLTFNYYDGSSYTTGPLTGVGNLGAANEWKLSGNAGTDPNVDFIGTTDSTDWVIRTDSLERVRVTSTGRVGIGTNNPVSDFQVKGTETIETTGTNNVTYQIIDDNLSTRYSERLNYDSTNSQLDINLISPDSLGEISVRYFRNTVSTAPKYFAFFRGNGLFDLSAKIGVDGQSSYFQNHGGNFGIGTSNPSRALTVESSGPPVKLKSTANGCYMELFTPAHTGGVSRAGWIGYASAVSPTLTIWNQTNGRMAFGTNDLERMSIDVNGNVGINTINPTEKLEIENGGIRINGFYGVGFTDQPYGNSTPNGNEGAKIYFDNTIFADPNRDYLVLEKKDGSSVNPDGGILFANRGNDGIRTPSMIVDGFGKVGIGTLTPPHKLSVLDGSIFSYNSSQNAATEIIPGGIELFRAPSISGYIDFKNLETEDFDFRVYNDSDFDGGNGSLVTRSLADNNIMVIQKNGNVGLNISAPQRTLHVNSVMRLEPIPTAPSSPAKGDMYFDSTLNKLRVYDGTTWQNCW
jgi:hypothetical protein